MLLSSRRHAFLFEKCCSRLGASDICFFKMRLALTRATSRTKISVLSRREQSFFKKHASRLHESNIRKTNVAPVDAIRIFIWKILLSSRRYAMGYLISKIFLLKMNVSLRREQSFRKKFASRLDESNIEKINKRIV